MSSRPEDDDALSWGDDDPTLDVGTPARREPDAGTARRPPASAPSPPTGPAPLVGAEEDVEPGGLGNAALVAIGLLAGAYLFFAIGWLIAGLRLQAVGDLPVVAPMLTAATAMATVAPPVWFVTSYVLTRRSRTWVRFAWLVAGVLLLVPWPFLFTGALA